ncbi:hypothetical protein [Tuberibacillus sp. Marseille-P3662]|uniref:hypothetical protein n=1 Tax=Tuberibacillus sp. Marseille-P3662 TaxID=1965358 RepID=UPI000A1CDE47|nr:hypothetical protein [Tuberibacillus sp. Marseille-P3662]
MKLFYTPAIFFTLSLISMIVLGSYISSGNYDSGSPFVYLSLILLLITVVMSIVVTRRYPDRETLPLIIGIISGLLIFIGIGLYAFILFYLSEG